MRIAQEGTWVFLADPDAVREVFTGDPAVFHAGEANRILRPWLGANSVLLLDERRHLASGACCCRRSTASGCSGTAS